MELSLCITTFNRFTYLPESFAQVINHPRITEIILMDDCSDMEIFKQVEGLKSLSPKIKVYRQAKNRGMSYNKYTAVGYAQNSGVILFDSDNVMTPAYIDTIFEELNPNLIYQPSFAKPHFDFRKYDMTTFWPKHASQKMKEPMFNTMLNACNYVVNRDEYLRVYEENPEHKASDTVWFAYLWLKAGNGFYVVRGMEYEHRVGSHSGFLADADYNMKKSEEVRKLIMQL